ncbi:ABC transporter permease [Jatrophihabitans fulvus]
MTLSSPETALVAAEHEPEARETPPTGAGRGQLLRYLGGKVLAAVVSLFVALNIGFLLFNVISKDPAGAITRGRQVSAEQKRALEDQIGANLPLGEKYANYWDNLIHFRLGYSFQFNSPVSSLILDRLGPTLLLLGTSTVISVALGLWLGARAGWRRGSTFDRVVSGASITLWSVPTFWLGLILLVVFAVGLGPLSGILPTGGMNSPVVTGGWIGEVLDTAQHLVLPVTTLVLVVFAQYLTIMRSSIIDELGSPYLLTARAKGLRDDVVRRRHAVPNALLPSVTVIFLHLGGIIGGAITVETVFSWPGLGYLTYQALNGPDVQLLQGCFLFFSASVIAMNLVADLLYRWLDPRVRAQ